MKNTKCTDRVLYPIRSYYITDKMEVKKKNRIRLDNKIKQGIQLKVLIRKGEAILRFSNFL